MFVCRMKIEENDSMKAKLSFSLGKCWCDNNTLASIRQILRHWTPAVCTLNVSKITEKFPCQFSLELQLRCSLTKVTSESEAGSSLGHGS